MTTEKQCEEFNARHPIGTPVTYWKGSRQGAPTGTSLTSTEAVVLSGHTAVVWLEAVSGCIALSHIEVKA